MDPQSDARWRSREEDVDLVVSVARELGARLVAEGASA
jgi:hypothetical protein